MKKPKKNRSALLERQSLRLQGLLNAPNRGRRGIGGVHGWAAYLRNLWGGRDYPPDWVQTRQGMRPHPKSGGGGLIIVAPVEPSQTGLLPDESKYSQ